MKSLYLACILLNIMIDATAQLYKQSNFENTIHGLTTMIRVRADSFVSKGTGFFFHKYNKAPGLDPTLYTNHIDSSLVSIWLITNKHVVLGDSFLTKPFTPEKLTFRLRKKVIGQVNPEWIYIDIGKSEIPKRLKQHSEAITDVVAIDVTDLVLPLLKSDDRYIYSAVSAANFPWNDDSYANGPRFSVGNTVFTVGYPEMFHDTFNLYPTIKTGIIASKWGAKYNNGNYFLIDCKLFPGSSGSIVISASTNYGDLEYFHFLGIYSGEIGQKITNSKTGSVERKFYDTGKVWYFGILREILK